MATIATFTQDAQAVLDYTIQYADFLGADTISTSTWVFPAGLTEGTSDTPDSNQSARVFISGGTDGEDYVVTNRIATAALRTAERSIEIQIRETSLPTIESTTFTLTVEDETGLAAANTYTTVAEANTYFASRLRASTWTGASLLDQARALAEATRYIDTFWAFKGAPEFTRTPASTSQALKWPRVNVDDWAGNVVEGIPTKLKDATCEYAIRLLVGELMPDPVYDESGNKIRMRSDRVGPITETRMFGVSAKTLSRLSYPEADKLLAEYIEEAGKVLVA